MAESALIKTVEKFDGSNFQAWKFQMNAVLITNAIQDVVTGQRVKPEDVNSADGKKWINSTLWPLVTSQPRSHIRNLTVC